MKPIERNGWKKTEKKNKKTKRKVNKEKKWIVKMIEGIFVNNINIETPKIINSCVFYADNYYHTVATQFLPLSRHFLNEKKKKINWLSWIWASCRFWDAIPKRQLKSGRKFCR